MIWNGTADSAIDLHPPSFPAESNTEAIDTNGFQQIGSVISYTGFGPDSDALLWNGAADSVIDLNAFLPPGFVSGVAHSIDAAGVVWGTATGPGGSIHAVKWVPVPEPQSLVIVASALIGAFGVLLRRYRASL